MASRQGDLALLNEPMVQKLLHSTEMAQLAYVWSDGTARVVPIWFYWTGQEIVFASPVEAPKVHVLDGQKVAITINTTTWPYQVLLVRGTARITVMDGIVPEYAMSAERYFGVDGGKAWLNQMGALVTQMARIAVTPEWVGMLDFQTRFPQAVEAAMAAAQNRG